MPILLSGGGSADGAAVTVRLGLNETVSSTYFKTSDTRLTCSPELMCCIATPIAMKRNEVVHAPAPVSPALLQGLHAVSEIFCAWYPELRPLKIQAELSNVPAPETESHVRYKVGSFFSGGVDSFYTLLKHSETITDLIVVRGFDVALQNDTLWGQVSAMARKVGAAMGKRVIEVETDVRSLLESNGLPWGEQSHGVALASVGHAVGADMKQIFIPASHTFRDLFPWGSHPLVDPHWSTEGLAFHHDGCEATRIDKVRLIAQHPVALSSLRVCYENRGNAYNCGRCEKCLRTMLNLAAVGALERASTFPTSITPKDVRGMRLFGDNGLAFAQENMEALEHVPGAEPLRRAMSIAAKRARLRAGVVSLIRGNEAVFNMAKRSVGMLAKARRSTPA